MTSKIQTVAVLLIVIAIITVLFAAREYRRESNSSQLAYTQSVKLHDIEDGARNSLAALQDAEVREQNYILTGETVYSEAYAASVRDWQDEIGTLALVAEHDKALSLVQDLSKDGDRTIKELALIVSLYDEGSRDKALDRIRKGAGIVYLDQARDSTRKILQARSEAANQNSRVTNAIQTLRRLAASVVALFCLTLAGAVLLMFETRRKRV
jgi:CHASE3 domain sensor protein